MVLYIKGSREISKRKKGVGGGDMKIEELVMLPTIVSLWNPI